MASPRQRRIFERIAGIDPQEVVRRLSPYVTERRAARIEAMIDGRLASVAVAVEAPQDPHNAAAVVRTAEALGVATVHVVAAEGRALEARRTTQGAHHWVEIRDHATTAAFLDDLRSSGHRVYGAATDADLDLDQVEVDAPLCILVGNETRGLSETARRAARLFRIPMVGMSQSLNLSVSAAIALYEVTRRRRALLGVCGDLSPEARNRLRAYAYAHSVDPRMLEPLLADAPRQGEGAPP